MFEWQHCPTGIENDVPEFNLEDLVKEAEEEFKPLISQSKEMAAQADKEIKKLEKELQALNHLQVRSKFCTVQASLQYAEMTRQLINLENLHFPSQVHHILFPSSIQMILCDVLSQCRKSCQA